MTLVSLNFRPEEFKNVLCNVIMSMERGGRIPFLWSQTYHSGITDLLKPRTGFLTLFGCFSKKSEYSEDSFSVSLNVYVSVIILKASEIVFLSFEF